MLITCVRFDDHVGGFYDHVGSFTGQVRDVCLSRGDVR